jgi:hypothetical protein
LVTSHASRGWLINSSGSNGEVVPEPFLFSIYDLAMKAFARNAKKGGLRFLVQSDEE